MVTSRWVLGARAGNSDDGSGMASTPGVLALVAVTPTLFLCWLALSGIWIIVLGVTKAVRKADDEVRGERVDWLLSVGIEAALAAIDGRRRVAVQHEPGPVGLESSFMQEGPMPPGQPYGVSEQGAGEICAGWMRHFGENDAAATLTSEDEGIDVASLHYIATVQNFDGEVGLAAIRELAGVAYADGRKPIFFTSGTYPTAAVNFADSAGIALLIYNAVAGTLAAGNMHADEIFRRGL